MRPVFSSSRGLEISYSDRQIDDVIKWVCGNTYIQSIPHHQIMFTRNFPEVWTTEQRLIAPLIAEFIHGNVSITLKDILNFQVDKRYLPNVLDIDRENLTAVGLSWSKIVKTYVSNDLRLQLNNVLGYFLDRDSPSFSVNSVKTAVNSSEFIKEEYRLNDIARALYLQGFDINVRVVRGMAFDIQSSPVVPERLLLNVAYDVVL